MCTRLRVSAATVSLSVPSMESARLCCTCFLGTEAAQAPKAGASRFAHRMRALKGEQDNGDAPALILFSGDVFNPSMISTVTRVRDDTLLHRRNSTDAVWCVRQGRHMVDVMNQLGVHASCHGNHDYDFGVDTLQQRAAACSA